MGKITVIGSFVMDMVARVAQFPLPGQTILGKSLRIYPGGKGANQCIAAKRLGAETEMIGMVGDDGYGRTFVELMKSEGVQSEHIFVTKKEPTAVAQVQISDSSENKIVVLPSANFEFSTTELNLVRETVKKSSLIMAQLELSKEMNSAIIRMCTELKVPLILNPAPAYPLTDEELSRVTILTPNETELEILSGVKIDTESDIFRAAEVLLLKGVKHVVATLGKRGAMIANAHGIERIDGYPVDVVDTVAAGDSFNGALAACLVKGMSLLESVKFANAVGALTVTKAGAIPSLPRLSELEDFIKSQRS